MSRSDRGSSGQRHVVIVKELANGAYLLKTSYPTDCAGGLVI